MKNKKFWLTACIIAVSLALVVIGYFLLPDIITMQITASGEAGNTLPKFVGLLVPFAVSAGAACAYYSTGRGKYLALSCFWIAFSLIMIFMNLA